MPNTPSPDDQSTALLERAWNALIPRSSIKAELIPRVGVKYLHPTKGWRYVSKKRFAIRGVI